MEVKKADVALGAAVAGIIAADIWLVNNNCQTISERFDDYLEHPVGKYLALGATAIVAAHVVNAFEAYDIPDPIHVLADKVSRLKRNDGS